MCQLKLLLQACFVEQLVKHVLSDGLQSLLLLLHRLLEELINQVVGGPKVLAEWRFIVLVSEGDFRSSTLQLRNLKVLID